MAGLLQPRDEVGETARPHGLRAADRGEDVGAHAEPVRVGEAVSRGDDVGRAVARRLRRMGAEAAVGGRDAHGRTRAAPASSASAAPGSVPRSSSASVPSASASDASG